MNDVSNIINEIVDNVCDQYIFNETIIEIEEECYICRDDIDSPLIDSPCVCNMKIHESCFLEYLDRLGNKCSVCRNEFIIPRHLLLANFRGQIRRFDFNNFFKRVILFSFIFYFFIYLWLSDYISIETYYFGCGIIFLSYLRTENRRRD